MLNKLLFLGLFLATAAAPIAAQKMSVLDYFKAFMKNDKSPNNQMAKMNATLVDKNGEQLIYYYANDSKPAKITYKDSYLTFVKGFHEGWNGQCYPTFKVYTKADGTQILGVTEDSYTHHSYQSKYRSKKASARQIAEKGKDICPQHQWDKRPKPIKFWTYEGGTWTEVTDQVMTEFFSLEEMITKTNTSSENIEKHIIHHIYPLYRIEPDKNEITVWVDEARLKLYTTEIEEFANAGDNLEHRQNGTAANKVYWDFLIGTSFKSYTLVWDAKAGKFVRK